MARADKTIVKCFLLCVFGVMVVHSWIPKTSRVASRQIGTSALKKHKNKGTETDLLKQKWRNIFKRMDLDQDEMITDKDVEILKNNYIRVYFLRDASKSVIVSKQIDKFIDCILFHEFQSSGGISDAKFLKIYKDAYEADRKGLEKRIRTCDGNLQAVNDRNKDGFLSFKEAVDTMKAWNQDNIELEHEMFQMMAPNKDNLVPLENVNDFFAELVMGENKDKFKKLKNAYTKAGLRVK